MEVYLELSERLLQSVVSLLLNPFYYIGILFIVLQVRKQIILERKLFHTRLRSLAGETWRIVLWGWAAGLLASLLMAVPGIMLPVRAVLLLWLVSLALTLLRVRFLCLAYAAGIVGLARSLAEALPAPGPESGLRWLTDALHEVHMPSLLALVAVLHLAEALLIRRQGRRLATPLFVESKRGKLVGAYSMQGFWPVPLFLLMPSGVDTAGTDGGLVLPWQPLFAGDWQAAAWTVLAVPAVIGFSSMTTAYLPGDKARQSSGLLLLYALLLASAAVLSQVWPPFAAIASVLSILLHEGIIRYGAWAEENRQPIFLHSPQGLKILSVLPGSPAAEAGIVTGETVHRVNGKRVATKEEFHEAMQANPAFCKLEILNLEGQSKFISKALYSDEHHQLGILLAPDDQASVYISARSENIMSYLHRRWMRIKANR